jgi:DNA-binding response OmpR family regulator
MNVLLVVDEPRMAKQLQKGLEHEGYSVVVAYDGESALELARNTQHDLLILDWMLPKLDGAEVARRLRRAKVQTPILMLTARDAPVDIVEGLDCGADDYLVKPFAFEVLLARLRALRRRGPPTRPPILEVADLKLDPATHRVARSSVEIRLSHREFALLQILMHRAGHVIPRARLIESVWGYESNISGNTLDAFIHLLRAKVDAEPARKLIHTVRGVGYCMSETPP